MRASLLVVCVAACGGDGGNHMMFDAPRPIDAPGSGAHDGPLAVAHAHAKVLNGATPTGAFQLASVAPQDGNWMLSPHQITMTLMMVSLTGPNGGTPMTAVDCPVTYDRSMPGLAQLGDCAFDVPPGTYDHLNLAFSTTISTLIEDDGFYSTATGVQTTMPAGGAVPYVWSIGQGFNNLAEPIGSVTITPGENVDLSIVINGLQSFAATVNNGVVSPNPMRPDIVGSAGTLAGIKFYVSQGLGTAASYCAGSCPGTTPPQGITSVSVYMPSATSASMVGLQLNGTPNNCGPIMPSFVADPKGYVGLDSNGVVGMALSGNNYGTYSALIAMPQTSTTTLYCLDSPNDPMPPGGSFASGAPQIQTAGNSQGTYVLVAQ